MLKFVALETDIARHFQKGGADANGQPPERTRSDGAGNPCRHCLREIPRDVEMLILSHRPFPAPQPYAETGPIFLCAAPCPRGGGSDIPRILETSPDYLMKGYSADHRIKYGTGRVISRANLPSYAKTLLDDPSVAYVHVRSARNNCYQLRIDRQNL